MLSSLLKSLAVLSALAVTIPTTLSAAIDSKRSISGVAIGDNFPDPSVIQVDGVWYAFATNSLGRRVPMAKSTDFNSWSIINGDALAGVGSWSNGANIWAPDVIRKPDGSFVMYYSANSADGSTHCVGAATSSSVTGPYKPEDGAIACAGGQGGAIDPAGFVDADGTIYVTYKIDGNNIGHGGNCNNGVAPIVPTPLMLQKMYSNGITPNGAPVQILDRDDGDGPLVEAPSLVRSGEGVYFLFFSSNCYAGPYYDVSYATATNIAGPYTKAQYPNAPLMVTGTSGLYSPGGADISADGTKLVFHADLGTNANTRQMYTANIKLSGHVASV